MKEADQIDRIEVFRELMSLADTTDGDWLPQRRRRRWVPIVTPSVRGRIAAIAGAAMTICFGAAVWSSAPPASAPVVSATPAPTAASAGTSAGHWLVSTGRPVNVFACSQEYLRSLKATTAAGAPTRASFVTDCVHAAGRPSV